MDEKELGKSVRVAHDADGGIYNLVCVWRGVTLFTECRDTPRGGSTEELHFNPKSANNLILPRSVGTYFINPEIFTCTKLIFYETIKSHENDSCDFAG